MQVRRMMSEGRIRRRNKQTANGTSRQHNAEEVPTLPATITHGKRVTGSAKVLQDDKIRLNRSNTELDEGMEGEDEFISFSTKRPFKPGDIEMDGPSVPWMFKKHSKTIFSIPRNLRNAQAF